MDRLKEPLDVRAYIRGFERLVKRPVPRYCFVRMLMGLAGSSSATTIPGRPFSVCVVSELSVK